MKPQILFKTPPPDRASPQYFIELLQPAIDAGWPASTIIGSEFPEEKTKDDREIHIHPSDRMILCLEGKVVYDISRSGRRERVELQPGMGLFIPALSWNIPHWDVPHFSVHCIFPHDYVRFTVVKYRSGRAQSLLLPSPWAWSTNNGLGAPGTHILRALDSQATDKSPDETVSRQLSVSLLRCALRRLKEDYSRPALRPASRLWREAVGYMNDHYTRTELSREMVATALGVHPNYLSSVATQEGNGFHRTLERIRIERANQLLRQCTHSVKEVASLCGFSSNTHFGHAYRRACGVSPGSVLKS